MCLHILTLVASVLIVVDTSPKPNHWRASSVIAPASQVEVLQNSSPTLLASGSFLSQRKQASSAELTKPSVLVHPASASMPEPPFLRRPVLFDPNSLEPSAAGRTVLKRAATWLREHGEARVLIVGSCDTSGSESCTHTLAEARATVIRKLLEESGVRSDQIVGVKAWDNVDQSCGPAEIKCKQLSRSAEMFMAGSSSRSKEKP